MKNKSEKSVPKNSLHKTDVGKAFYCYNEKKWLDKCKEQCMSCYVEMIRTKVQ